MAFGFWLPVEDAASARQAVRMAGQPVLIMAVNALLVALSALVQVTPEFRVAAVAGTVAVGLAVIAFRMHAGNAGLVPIMVVLFVVFALLNMVLSVLGHSMTRGPQFPIAALALTWIVPVFAGALALSGLRGWLWMRRNGGLSKGG
ncbi:hypothetical protein [Yoonia sp. R2-816]|uniref:hypothetical protein n=1 Tax=Yoonia sp. R2-816 TaxID=3342638 RepID=UPI0037262A0F